MLFFNRVCRTEKSLETFFEFFIHFEYYTEHFFEIRLKIIWQADSAALLRMLNYLNPGTEFNCLRVNLYWLNYFYYLQNYVKNTYCFIYKYLKCDSELIVNTHINTKTQKKTAYATEIWSIVIIMTD